MGLKYPDYILGSEVSPPEERYPEYDIKLHPVVSCQAWGFGDIKSLLRCHESMVHFDSEW